VKQPTVHPTGRERTWAQEDIIVSKTDLKGIITYCNRTFLKVADYSEEEVLGQPHSIIRHPDMPRCVFKLLWDTIEAEREIFAYVKNMAKNGDHYWVFAHVTPTFDAAHRITGYHSNRRCPDRHQVQLFDDLYRQLLTEERKAADWRTGMNAATNVLMDILSSKKMSYDEFIFSV
jgi:PAS domain S-box-containing protein